MFQIVTCWMLAGLCSYLVILLFQIRHYGAVLLREPLAWVLTAEIILLAMVVCFSIVGIILKMKEIRRDNR